MIPSRPDSPWEGTSRSWTRAAVWCAALLLLHLVAFHHVKTAVAQPVAEGIASIALVPDSGSASSGGGFERLEMASTGLDFVHQWIPPHISPHLQPILIQSQNAGGGVCVGDFDDDGHPDVFLTRPHGGSRLYRNLGRFRLVDVTDEAGLGGDTGRRTWGTGPTFVDIDNDDDLDLYVCAYNGPNRLYVNQGDGTFREQAKAFGLDYQGASVCMAFADYDRDGDLDGYLVTNRVVSTDWRTHHFAFRDGVPTIPEERREFSNLIIEPDGNVRVIRGAQFDHLYRNNGDGTFTDVSTTAFGDATRRNYFGLSATWWDHNDDGWPDLYVANDFYGPDHLYRNNGDGTFTDVIRTAIPHTPWFSMGSDAGDLNNDGRLDYMASDMSGTTHYKQKLSMGDMGDGWFLTRPEPRQYMRNAVYLNTGTPRFMEVAYLTGLSGTDWTWTVKIADLDNDAYQDVFITNGTTRDWMNSDLQPQGITALLASPPRREANLAIRNRGDLQFHNVAEAWGLDLVAASYGAALGDLDRDGDLDLVVNNFEEPAAVYRNLTNHGHGLLIRLRGTLSNRRGIGAMVRITGPWGTQARYATLARGFESSDDDLIHFGLGDAEKIDRLTVQWPSGHVQRFENLQGGRLYTITEPRTPSTPEPPAKGATTSTAMFAPTDALAGVDHLEAPFDDFARQPLLPHQLSQLGPGMAWGDVDNDRDDDLYVGGAAGQAGMLYINSGRGRLTWGPLEPFATDRRYEDMAPVFFDADGDGDMDLYVVSGGVECEIGSELLEDRLYLNDGVGRFTRVTGDTLPAVRDSGSGVAAADFDCDGDLDLFVGGRSIPGQYPLTPTSRLLQNDRGRFTDVTDELAPRLSRTGLVTAAVWSDADGDGWLDLLVTHEWGPVKFYRNRDGRLEDETARAGLAERLGWWNGIAARDIDNDGDIDYVATNFGLNAKYHASADKPAILHYGDFERTGRMRLIEAEYEEDNLYPVRGKSCSTNAMPHLANKFTTFHQFAVASLQEIYTPQCLADAHRFEANTLESSVLINEGDGRFSVQVLPRIAQASPAFGVVLTEVDGDGIADLYLVQNFFGPQRETGRMDGGVSLLMTGKGDGGFTPVWPDRSGLLVPGDAKGLTAADLNDDGWADFAVAVNDDQLMAFENKGTGSHRPFKVRLFGPVGNPTAIGARVTLQPADAPTQTAEVQAGGSYLSQSTNDLFFGLGRSGVVERIEVRWPDGQGTTTTPSSDAGSSISIEHPSHVRIAEAPSSIDGRQSHSPSEGEGDDHAAAHRELARALHVRGRFEAATRHLRRALSIHPDDPELHTDLGATLAAQGRSDDAVHHYRRALAITTDHGRTLNLLGRSLWQEGRHDKAMGYYRRALESEPDLLEAHMNLASALHEKGELEEAVEHFGHVLRMNPTRAQLLTQLGGALAAEGRREAAKRLYRKILAVAPTHAEAHLRLGQVLEVDGEFNGAITHYERTVELEPENAVALTHLGDVLGHEGRTQEAIGCYRKAINADPSYTKAHFKLGAALESQGQLDEAIRQFTTVVKLRDYIEGSGGPEARLAHLYQKRGRLEDALRMYRVALNLQPRSLTYLNQVAWLLATHPHENVRNPDEAIRLARRAVAIAEEPRPGILDTLAVAYAAAGRFDEAVLTSQQAESIAVSTGKLSQAVVDEIRKHMELFKQGRPYVLP